MNRAPDDYTSFKSGENNTSNERPRELASPVQAVTRNDDLQNYYYMRHPQTYPIPNTAPPSDRRLGSSKHSRSHSHNADQKQPKHRLFHPVNHNAYQQYPSYPMNVSSPKPSSAPPLSPQSRRQNASTSKNPWHAEHVSRPSDAQPNWTKLIPPLSDTPRESAPTFATQHTQSTQPVSNDILPSNGHLTPENQRQKSRSSSHRSNLDPSQRHSIAISPTPEKQSEEGRRRNDDPLAAPKPQQTISSRPKTKKKSRKVCQKCGLEITGQFVRALQSAYHVECFTCHECGKQCSAKFFPYDINQDGKTTQVALCEYDYFKKLDLICFSCDSALRGPYITALGNKYHLEHFKCSVCQHVFDSDESYFEHENDIFCHFHYSKLYASHCEGCQSSILKQFVELYRGGRTQHWHPECFMVHKFWNVCITADSVGLQRTYGLADEKLADLRAIKMADTSLNSERLVDIEQHIEQVVMNCWLMLSGYEQSTAACISDMLLNACTGNKYNGLVVTGKLILNVEILFHALDYVLSACKVASATLVVKYEQPEQENSDSSVSENEYFQFLKKEPRNITGKIMSYLAILRKSASISKSGTLSAELLSVITGSAHYLKLLIRIGLYNALKLNKLNGTTETLDHFLHLVSRYETIESNKLETVEGLEEFKAKLTVPQSSTDACTSCSKSIEKSCVKLGDHRWHWKCFTCAKCQQRIDQADVQQTRFDIARQCIICSQCYDGSGVTGFEIISDLSQLVYLLKIALLRSRSVMNIDFVNPAITASPETELLQTPDRQYEQDDYSKTLDDVTRLRSKRQNQKLSQSVKKKARKSVIITAPEGDQAHQDEVDTSKVGDGSLATNMGDLVLQTQPPQFGRKASSGSQLSFEGREELSVRKQLQIRDEPQRQLTATHLDRTSDLLKNEKSLTLDDIPRIVAAEQARDQRPNAFKHQNKLYQRTGSHKLKGSGHSPIQTTPSSALDHILNTTTPANDSPTFEKQKFYSELTKREHFIMRHIAVEMLCQMNHEKYNKDELLSMIQLKKPPTFWDKLRFGSGGASKDKNNAVFGSELSILTKKYGVDSDLGVGPSKLRIPIVVDDVISALKQKDMSVEGIFRLNGNIKKLRELTEQINKSPYKSPDFSAHTAVQLAALMKKWLRELPTPLLTFSCYDLWISSQTGQTPEQKKKILQLTYCLLPRDHRNLLEVLLYFFSWVASFSEVDKDTGSKMDAHNLATVLAPNILISKQTQGQNEQTGDAYFLAIEVVNQLIEQHEELSIIPSELMKIFNACGFDGVEKDLSSKDILNQIERVLKEDAK
ncbi:rga1 [Candida margitis]|uniref:rga1 n=1 Tax=Candida margitis TaxID=1775924 RepID=UPI00222731DD|nr:rga1 [Candida margitis]KAI5970570.1 rga1 [Candida margitis]